MSTFDTILWIFSAAISFAMGALGGHLASDKPRYRYSFWGLGIIGMVVVIVAGFRNQIAQDKYTQRLADIYVNTQKVGFLQFGPVFPVDGSQKIMAGAPVLINDSFGNRSADSVSEVRSDANLDLAENSMAGEISSEARFLQRLRLELNSDKRFGRSAVAPGDPLLMNTSESRVLTKEDVRKIRALKLVFYLHLYLQWKDKEKTERIEQCWWILTPPSMKFTPENTVLHECSNLPAGLSSPEPKQQ